MFAFVKRTVGLTYQLFSGRMVVLGDTRRHRADADDYGDRCDIAQWIQFFNGSTKIFSKYASIFSTDVAKHHQKHLATITRDHILDAGMFAQAVGQSYQTDITSLMTIKVVKALERIHINHQH